MRGVITLACVLVLFTAGTGYTASPAPSAMVEKEIFGSDSDSGPLGGAAKSPEALKLEREITFTGVIVSAEGKRAMIRETRRGPNAGEEKSILKEGDEIKGMTIKEIGSNYLILAGQGKEVRLHLYSEAKQRPAPPPEPKAPELPAAEGEKVPAPTTPASPGAPTHEAAPAQPGVHPTPGPAQRARRPQPRNPQKTQTQQNAQQGTNAPSSNPFAEALKRAAQGGGQPTQTTPATNAFLDAIQRAQQGRN
jgi:hypothetical protein